MIRLFSTQVWGYFKHYIKCELSSKERFYAPFLFASTLLVVFNFAFSEGLPREVMKNIFVAEIFITTLFAVQMSFMRQFDLESEDNAFEVFRLSRLNSYAFFLGKYAVSLIAIAFVVIPTVLLAWFFLASELRGVSLNTSFCFTLALVLIGLSALGSLMGAVLQKLSGRELLYPLFFYPLSSPLFLLGQQTALLCLEGEGVSSFLWILLGLDLIYLVLALLLFDEVLN